MNIPVSHISPKEAAEMICADYEGDKWTADAERLDINGIQATIYNEVAIFRGSNDRRDWCRNLLVSPSVLLGDSGKWWVHGALVNAQTNYAFLKGKRVKLIIGHSAGGPSAQIVGYSLGIAVWTFASPRALYWGTPVLKAPQRHYLIANDPIRHFYPFAKFIGDVEMLPPHPGKTLASRHRGRAYLEALSA